MLDPTMLDPTMLEQRNNIFEQISVERERQDQLHPSFPLAQRTDILIEEVGEVSKARLEGDLVEMRRELIEVAAVCVRWIEVMDHASIGSMRNMNEAGISPTEEELAFYRAAIKQRTL